jgi:hypothetical protein
MCAQSPPPLPEPLTAENGVTEDVLPCRFIQRHTRKFIQNPHEQMVPTLSVSVLYAYPKLSNCHLKRQNNLRGVLWSQEPAETSPSVFLF